MSDDAGLVKGGQARRPDSYSCRDASCPTVGEHGHPVTHKERAQVERFNDNDAALIARVRDRYLGGDSGVLALCALAERVPELERAVEHEASSYRRFVKHVDTFTGGSLLHYKELLAYRDEIERLRQLAEARVATLEGVLAALDAYGEPPHQSGCSGEYAPALEKCGVVTLRAAIAVAVRPARRDADGAEGESPDV